MSNASFPLGHALDADWAAFKQVLLFTCTDTRQQQRISALLIHSCQCKNACWTGSAGPAMYILAQSTASNQSSPGVLCMMCSVVADASGTAASSKQADAKHRKWWPSVASNLSSLPRPKASVIKHAEADDLAALDRQEQSLVHQRSGPGGSTALNRQEQSPMHQQAGRGDSAVLDRQDDSPMQCSTPSSTINTSATTQSTSPVEQSRFTPRCGRSQQQHSQPPERHSSAALRHRPSTASQLAGKRRSPVRGRSPAKGIRSPAKDIRAPAKGTRSPGKGIRSSTKGITAPVKCSSPARGKSPDIGKSELIGRPASALGRLSGKRLPQTPPSSGKSFKKRRMSLLSVSTSKRRLSSQSHNSRCNNGDSPSNLIATRQCR